MNSINTIYVNNYSIKYSMVGNDIHITAPSFSFQLNESNKREFSEEMQKRGFSEKAMESLHFLLLASRSNIRIHPKSGKVTKL